MDSLENFDKTSILDKETFYTELNKEGITDEDYARYKKRYLKNFVKILEIIMIYIFNLIRFCLLMFLKILEIFVFKNMSLTYHIFIQHQD